MQQEVRKAVTESLTFMPNVIEPQWQQCIDNEPSDLEN